MSILALGISHRHASVELLERLSFPDEELPKAYRRASDEEVLDETVILSTCNRVEIYGSVPAYHAGFLALKRLLCESHGVDPDELSGPLYSHYEEDAAQHVFRVAAGLDSMVIGEPQILTQVRAAHRRAVAEGAAGPILGALFAAAGRAGKRARGETSIEAAPDAFVRAGIQLADKALNGLKGRRAVIVGAGHMANLAGRAMREHGIGPVRVLNRSPERARAMAERIGGEHGGLADLAKAIGGADLVVSATGSTGPVLEAGTVRGALSGRDRPLFVLDLAVPRDAEPPVGSIPGVTLVNIEGLRGVSERATGLAGEMERADAIVDEEVRRFVVRRRAERLAPLIRALRDRGDRVLASEFRRFASELEGLPADKREAVEALARGIVSKLLHDPIVRLKELSGPGNDATYATVLAELFGVEQRPE
jgi:glutamyl-tRNA reductase